jgi:hypothetical protein
MGNVPQLPMIMIMIGGHIPTVFDNTKARLVPDSCALQYNVVQTAGVHRVYSFVQFGPNQHAVVK